MVIIVQDKNNLLKIKIKNCNYFESNRIARFVLS